ncbi:MAG: hypothetical protein QNK35_17605 [Bacteroides sp.]|nr:hypothetical protein [Bacteroides sp.]
MQRINMLSFPLLFLLMFSCMGPSEKKKEIKEVRSNETLQLLAENPRYLEYKGNPLILITSAEHYGAVLNMDFDYKLYLETLGKEGLNYTRIFTGPYIEPVENIFGIKRNTLAPLPGRFIAPWVLEEGKYDLSQFNDEYFQRLKDFVEEAEKQGIVVEVTLFTSIYAEGAWELSPFNIRNNVNGVGDVPFKRVNTLFNGKLLDFQEVYIRKVVRELNPYDNIFFEIQNEPWSDNQNLAGFVNESDEEVHTRAWQKEVVIANGLSMDWQAWVSSLIKNEEKVLPKSHLIAQNICNYQYELEGLPEGISMINFHYALPGAVQMNLDLGAVIGLDETGFMPHEEQLYLDQAWRVVLSGAGLYNNLDYSFTAGSEQGDWPIPDSNPGWGGPQFREKLGILVRTMAEVPFWDMEFSGEILASETSSLKQYGLQKEGEVYLLFLEMYEGGSLVPGVAPGDYEVSFIDVDSGERSSETRSLGKGEALHSPLEAERFALMIRKSDF